jgi:hypothetical protein
MGQKIKHRQRQGASRHKAPRKYNAQDYSVEDINRKLNRNNKLSFSFEEEDFNNYTQEDFNLS